MKAKTLIKLLQQLDPEAVVLVQEYNGWEDACRPVTSVKGLGDVGALSEYWRKQKRDPKTPLFVIRGLE